jgi:hypothetical protein
VHQEVEAAILILFQKPEFGTISNLPDRYSFHLELIWPRECRALIEESVVGETKAEVEAGGDFGMVLRDLDQSPRGAAKPLLTLQDPQATGRAMRIRVRLPMTPDLSKQAQVIDPMGISLKAKVFGVSKTLLKRC